MNMMNVASVIIFVAGLTITGCEQPKEGSATKEAVEDLTGMTTIKQGNAMKKKLQAIEKAGEQREKEVDAVE